MSKLRQLMGKGKIYELGGMEIEFQPFRLDELDKFQVDEKAPPSEQLKQSKILIKEFLKKAVPDATEEELSSISVEYMPKIMEIFSEMHNLEKMTNARKLV